MEPIRVAKFSCIYELSELMISKNKLFLAFVTGLLLSLPVYAQICEPTLITENLSEENFLADDINGTIKDEITELKWARCAYGQNWSGNACEGFPEKLNWQDALTVADNLDYGNIIDWRVPDIKELMSIIDFQCFIPPLSTAVFPQAPASIDNGLWSSTPVQTNPTSTEVKIWFIDMAEGKLKKRAWNQTNFVFFVTGGKTSVVRP